MREKDILDRFAKSIISNISKKRKVIGFCWNIDYHQNTRPYWPHTESAPGFEGRVWIRYANNAQGFGSDGFRETKTYTGTGGAGSYGGPWDSVYCHEYYARRLGLEIERPSVEWCYSWDYRFLLCLNQEHLGELEEIINHENLMGRLKGSGSFYLNHRYLFNEDGIVEKDCKFVEEVKKMGGEELVKLKTERY